MPRVRPGESLSSTSTCIQYPVTCDGVCLGVGEVVSAHVRGEGAQGAGLHLPALLPRAPQAAPRAPQGAARVSVPVMII